MAPQSVSQPGNMQHEVSGVAHLSERLTSSSSAGSPPWHAPAREGGGRQPAKHPAGALTAPRTDTNDYPYEGPNGIPLVSQRPGHRRGTGLRRQSSSCKRPPGKCMCWKGVGGWALKPRARQQCLTQMHARVTKCACVPKQAQLSLGQPVGTNRGARCRITSSRKTCRHA